MDSAPRPLTLKKSIALHPQQLAAAQKKKHVPNMLNKIPFSHLLSLYVLVKLDEIIVNHSKS